MTSSVSERDLLELSSEEDDGTQPGTESQSDESETEGHLCEDLELALEEDKLEVPSSYAYSTLLPFAPHSCLNIKGLGSIGLPLTETDAKRVIACASQAPYGQGDQTIINKKVRDTWEIDPGRVKFENPNWLTYIRDLAVLTVCSSLGLKNYHAPPRCELYKLLVYETGSRFLPHRDTQKADGMFATMIVILPSQYTGGEVHLTHASKTQVIDFSASSLANTAVLAWYTDVLHEVKPITSGYRLALSYNLIHTSPLMALPKAPTDDGPCADLRRVLHNWEKGKYAKPVDCNYIAYLLQHKYSEIDFKRGEACLKGEDSERVALVRAAAEGLGFVVLLANMEYHVSENPDYGLGWGYGGLKRRRGCAFGMPWVDDIDGEVDISLSKIFDLDGSIVLAGSPWESFWVNEDCFLPKDALKDESPDDTEESGYTGNEGATVDYWYHRSVFVLMLSDQLPRILMQNGGIGYVIKLFKESLSGDIPTKKDRLMAKNIVSNLHRARGDKSSATKSMLHYAYKWKDFAMWQDLIKSYNLQVQGEDGLVRAWRVFKFDQTRASVEDLLRKKCFADRLAFINAIRQAASESNEKKAIQEWCLNETGVALTSYVSANVIDVPLFVSMACDNGIQSIRQVPIENLVYENAFIFLIALVKELHSKQAVVLEKTAAQCAGNVNPKSEAARILQEFVRTCLDCAGKQLNVMVSGPSYYLCGNGQRAARMVDFIELCLLTRQMDMCRSFLDRIWNVSGQLVDKFNTIYTPLVPELCKLLQKTNTDVCAPPFVDFFRLAISYYLCHLLGSKEQRVQLTRKIGCGCGDCQELDRFITGKESQHTFRLVQKRRTHLEHQMNKARDLVTHETIRCGSPHSLVATKTPAAAAASAWDYRLQVINRMLSAIGANNVQKIMGNRYVDVVKAVKGEAAFRLDKPVAQGQQQSVPGPASALTVTGTSNKTTSVIGGKRKQGH
ncbi:hypothetical protein F5887DRAFT_1280476 [Amanita rubescens]|nr:hypothetical protein F5887DRAFT_1280476 [Amanita rubescens]